MTTFATWKPDYVGFDIKSINYDVTVIPSGLSPAFSPVDPISSIISDIPDSKVENVSDGLESDAKSSGKISEDLSVKIKKEAEKKKKKKKRKLPIPAKAPPSPPAIPPARPPAPPPSAGEYPPYDELKYITPEYLSAFSPNYKELYRSSTGKSLDLYRKMNVPLDYAAIKLMYPDKWRLPPSPYLYDKTFEYFKMSDLNYYGDRITNDAKYKQLKKILPGNSPVPTHFLSETFGGIMNIPPESDVKQKREKKSKETDISAKTIKQIGESLSTAPSIVSPGGTKPPTTKKPVEKIPAENIRDYVKYLEKNKIGRTIKSGTTSYDILDIYKKYKRLEKNYEDSRDSRSKHLIYLFVLTFAPDVSQKLFELGIIDKKILDEATVYISEYISLDIITGADDWGVGPIDYFTIGGKKIDAVVLFNEIDKKNDSEIIDNITTGDYMLFFDYLRSGLVRKHLIPIIARNLFDKEYKLLLVKQKDMKITTIMNVVEFRKHNEPKKLPVSPAKPPTSPVPPVPPVSPSPLAIPPGLPIPPPISPVPPTIPPGLPPPPPPILSTIPPSLPPPPPPIPPGKKSKRPLPLTPSSAYIPYRNIIDRITDFGIKKISLSEYYSIPKNVSYSYGFVPTNTYSITTSVPLGY